MSEHINLRREYPKLDRMLRELAVATAKLKLARAEAHLEGRRCDQPWNCTWCGDLVDYGNPLKKI